MKLKSGSQAYFNLTKREKMLRLVTPYFALKIGLSTLYKVRARVNVIWVIILRLMDKSFIFRYLLADLLSVNDSSFNAPHNQNPGCGRRINQLGTALMVNIPCIMGLFKLAGHPIPPCRSSVFH